MNSSREGTAAGWALAVLLTTTAALTAGHLWVSSGIVSNAAQHGRVNAIREIDRRVMEVVHALEGDWTPEAESPHDPVWRLLDVSNRAGVSMCLSDPSGAAADSVYTNANTVSPELIEPLLLRRGVPPARAYSVASALRRRRKMNERISEEQLRVLLGELFPQVYPFLSELPSVNVNFASAPRIIDTLPPKTGPTAAPSRSEVASALLAERVVRELDASELARLLQGLQIDEHSVVDLGVHTWTWELTCRYGNRETLVHLVRLVGERRAEYRVIGSRTKREDTQ